MTERKRGETPIQIALKAMRDEDGANGKRLTLDQIAAKYYGGDRIKTAFAISTARQYAKAFGTERPKKTVDI